MAAHPESLTPRWRAWRRLALIIALAAGATDAGSAQAIPQRIVSLVPSVTESVFAIGAGPRVVGVSSFDHFPAEVDALPRVGGLIDPDVERILSLRPDLVVAYASQSELIARLARAGVTVFPFKHGGLGSVATTLRELGRLLGVPAGAERVAREVDTGLARVRQAAGQGARPRTVLVIGRQPGSLRSIEVSGGYGFLHDLLVTAGAENVFGDVPRESLTVTTETLLARAPDVIIELHYTTEPPADAVRREGDAWNSLPGLPAVRSGRVVLLYGGELVVPGPRVVRTAEVLARAIRTAPER
jgi:iron complex transport system substrate-binding protein